MSSIIEPNSTHQLSTTDFSGHLLSPRPSSWSGPTFLVLVISYIALCSVLRFRRVNSDLSRYGFKDRASLGKMTNQQAHSIANGFITYDFPLFYDFSLRLALFQTYAMENGGKVLHSVSDLKNPEYLPKRYADTEILYACFSTFPPTSPELHKAVARMNFLHAPYIKAGKITQEDLLYVLYASMAEPIRFINQYEWRTLTEMETAALGTMWKYIGDMMNIEYKKLLGKDTWIDGIEFIEDVTRWSNRYEDEMLRPVAEVQELGHILMDMLLQSHAKIATPLAYPAACVLMGNRLRRVFGFPEPGLAMTVVTYGLLLTRKLIVRHLCLPRLTPARYISLPDPKTGRMNSLHYMKEPWYVPSTTWTRWNLEALITRLSGGMLPGDGGARMKPEGFLFEDIGPERHIGRGIEEYRSEEDRVRLRIGSGCVYGVAS